MQASSARGLQLLGLIEIAIARCMLRTTARSGNDADGKHLARPFAPCAPKPSPQKVKVDAKNRTE